jgi:outer membrane protein TolC
MPANDTEFRVVAAFILLGLLVSGSAVAAPLTLTLDQAVSYALEHNRTLAQAQTDVDKADARIDEAMSGFYPTVSLQGGFAYLSDVSVLTLPTGVPGKYMVVPLGSHANYDGKLALSQTLFAGNRVNNGYKAALLGRDLTAQSIVRKQQELIYDVRRTFYSVLMLQEMLKLTRQSQERTRDHLNQIIALQNEGFVSSYDSLRTAVQVENLTPQLTKLDNGIRMTLEGFKLLIGMPPEQELALDGELSLNESPVNEEDAVNQALANRNELQALDNTIRLNRLTRKITEGAYWPAVAAGATYDLKRPVSLTGSGWGSSMTFTLGLNYTLLDGFRTRAQLKQADADIRKLQLTRDIARDGIVVEVREAVTSIGSAKASIDAAQSNIKAAERSVKLAEARYAEGHGSNLDVLDAQLALFQAQVNQLTAIKDYDEAYARLIKAIGKEK